MDFLTNMDIFLSQIIDEEESKEAKYYSNGILDITTNIMLA